MALRAELQLVPRLVEYCQEAPASRPATMIVPLLVKRSVLEEPVSISSARVGAGAVVSREKEMGADGVPRLPVASATLAEMV